MAKFWATIIAFLAAACAPTAYDSGYTGWAVYKRADGGSPSIAVSADEVAYIDTRMASDPEIAARGTDQAAPAGDCSDERFNCFRLGADHLVVPRDSADRIWTYQDTTCRRTDDHGWWVVRCEHRQRVATFRFRPDYGVSLFSFEEDGAVFVHFSGHPLMAP